MKKSILLAAVLLVTRLPLLAAAPDQVPPFLTMSQESHIFLTGNSTLHPYSSTSTLTQFIAVLKEPVALVDIARRAPFQKFEVTIPVKGLKSGESGLDKNMYKALKAVDHPEIRFVLDRYEAMPATSDGVIPFKAKGQLFIAGAQKEMILTGTAHPQAEVLMLDGQYELRMSDYGIKPPKLLMGAIKVADPVVIHFHLLFQLKKES